MRRRAPGHDMRHLRAIGVALFGVGMLLPAMVGTHAQAGTVKVSVALAVALIVVGSVLMTGVWSGGH